MKQCIKCRQNKPVDQFYRKSGNLDKIDGRCKGCSKLYHAQLYIKNKELYQRSHRKYYLANRLKVAKYNTNLKYKARYGITTEQKNQMLEEQNNKCAICQRVFLNTKDQCVDHNHISKKVRMILCNNCNKGLGCFNDDVDLLVTAAKYLLKFN